MRQDLLSQAADFLATKGDLKDQITFLEGKGLSPKEIYYAMMKAGIYIPLKYNYFTSLLLGGGLIFAASKFMEYSLNIVITPLQESLRQGFESIQADVDKIQIEVQLMSNDLNDCINNVKETSTSNATQLNDIIIDMERLESAFKQSTSDQEQIISNLVKEVNHLKTLLSKSDKQVNPE